MPYLRPMATISHDTLGWYGWDEDGAGVHDDQIEHGHHVYRAYFKHAFLKQYEKFCTFLRNELCSNNLKDFGLKKSLDNLDAVREKFQTITSRFAGFQAQWLNVHVDFPLLQRIALPITKRLGALPRHQDP
jgi:hypothetical protein